MTAPPRGAQSLPDIISSAFTLVVRYRVRFLILAVPGALLSSGAYALLSALGRSLPTNTTNSAGQTTASIGVSLEFFGVSMALLLAAFVAEALLVPAAFDALLGKQPNIRNAFATVGRQWFPLLVGWVLISASVLIMIGLVLPAPLGIFLAVRWSFFVQELIREPSGAIGAMRRSASAVRGCWWRTAGVHVAIVLLSQLPNILVQLALRGVNVEALSVAMAGFAVLISDPFGAAARTTLYADTMLRKGQRLESAARVTP
ncbi:MAG: hypothetical protein ACYDCQ_15535 [Dehalococcoidia bacterium]